MDNKSPTPPQDNNPQPTPSQAERSDFVSGFLKKLPFMMVGILMGMVAVILYQGHLAQITKGLYDAALVVFGAMVLTFGLVFGFREYLTRFVFGKKVEKAGDLMDDAQQASNVLIERLADRFLTDADGDIKDQVKTFAPRFANWFVWGRLRNWWWQWLVGIATFLVGLVGTLLLINQNELLKNQNTLIERQMSLEEASRRSSLIVLMSNIMDKVDGEIDRQRKSSDTDKTQYKLSASLIGQIAALSHSFKPYRFMNGDTLIIKPLSPERGQLFITLVQLPLDTNTFKEIYQKSIFENADLKSASLFGLSLKKVHLDGADLTDSDFDKTDLSGAYLRGANLSNANLREANLSNANLKNAILQRATLKDAILEECYFKNVDLNGADLSGADLSRSDLRGANLSQAYLPFAILEYADLSDTNLFMAELGSTELKGAIISIKNALVAKSFINCNGFNDSIKTIILKERPELFQEPKK